MQPIQKRTPTSLSIPWRPSRFQTSFCMICSPRGVGLGMRWLVVSPLPSPSSSLRNLSQRCFEKFAQIVDMF